MAAATQYFIAAKTGTANRQIARTEGFGVLYLPGWKIDPDQGQAWAYDNGAYADYLERARRQGLVPFVDAVYGEDEQSDMFAATSRLPGIDTNRWVRGLRRVAAHPQVDDCVLVALPDLVNDARSLDKSIEALELALAEGHDLPYYLVVQPDPADPRDESEDTYQRIWHLLDDYPQIAGLFIGGDNEFKTAMGQVYADLAHEFGRRVHYGRASSRRKIREAVAMGCATCDSTQHQRYQSWYQISDVDPHDLGDAIDQLTALELERLREIDRHNEWLVEPMELGDDLGNPALGSQERFELDMRLYEVGILVFSEGLFVLNQRIVTDSVGALTKRDLVALKEAA